MTRQLQQAVQILKYLEKDSNLLVLFGKSCLKGGSRVFSMQWINWTYLRKKSELNPDLLPLIGINYEKGLFFASFISSFQSLIEILSLTPSYKMFINYARHFSLIISSTFKNVILWGETY